MTPAVAGFVITHGTNTLEETAYFLNLTVKSDKPVVLVGSQRPATAISADGPLNLLNAVRTACPPTQGQGALIVMNDEINGARDTTKTNTYRVETFRSPELGLLGYVDEDAVAFYRRGTRATRATPSSTSQRYAAAEGRDPLLVCRTGRRGDRGGRGTARERHRLGWHRHGAISKSRRRSDEVVTLPAARPVHRAIEPRRQRPRHGRRRLRRAGNHPADTLNPQKARILLMLALTRTTDPAEIRRMFDQDQPGRSGWRPGWSEGWRDPARLRRRPDGRGRP